jgi:hypothetical protein
MWWVRTRLCADRRQERGVRSYLPG